MKKDFEHLMGTYYIKLNPKNGNVIFKNDQHAFTLKPGLVLQLQEWIARNHEILDEKEYQ